MSDEMQDDNIVTAEDVKASVARRYGLEANRVAFSANREDAFVLIGGTWQRMDLTDAWHPHDPVPGYIPEEYVEQFYRWLEKSREAEHRKGRKFGEEAMRSAFRGLIGAAALVDLENNTSEEW